MIAASSRILAISASVIPALPFCASASPRLGVKIWVSRRRQGVRDLLGRVQQGLSGMHLGRGRPEQEPPPPAHRSLIRRASWVGITHKKGETRVRVCCQAVGICSPDPHGALSGRARETLPPGSRRSPSRVKTPRRCRSARSRSAASRWCLTHVRDSPESDIRSPDLASLLILSSIHVRMGCEIKV